MAISDEIRVIRQKALMTQEAFAKALQVAFTTVNRWEAGKAHPGISTMKRIKSFCEGNGISFYELQNTWIEETKESRK
ncbi:MAG: helix-turn-helix transcriptional regulator [Eubacteriaceae bacterium]|nr:helix-turn-helix transcriptional regulator [Eubacteriaceae bacterium]